MVGVFGALFGLSALLAGIVIQLANTGWRFAILALPLVFACLIVAELRRSVRNPDEPRGAVLADPASASSAGKGAPRS